MNQVNISNQKMDFQKTIFDSIVSSMSFYWDSTQCLSRFFVKNSPVIPEQGKQAFIAWVKSNRAVLEIFKRNMEGGFNIMSMWPIGFREQEQQHERTRHGLQQEQQLLEQQRQELQQEQQCLDRQRSEWQREQQQHDQQRQELQQEKQRLDQQRQELHQEQQQHDRTRQGLQQARQCLKQQSQELDQEREHQEQKRHEFQQAKWKHEES